MRISIACILLIGATATAWSQNSYYFPVAADGGGVRTSLLLTNPGVRAANLAIAWTNDDGSPRGVSLGDLGSDSSFALVLAAGATRVLQTAGGGDNSSGAAVVTSDQAVDVWGVQSAYDGAGSLQSESGFAAASTSTGFRIPVDSATGVALYNAGSAAASITATFADASGAVVASQMFTLTPGGRVTRFVSGNLFDGPADFHGTLDITSTAPLAAQTIRATSLDSKTGAILEAAPATSKRMKFYFAHLADGPSATATLRTTFLMTNLSKASATVTAALAHDDGSPWTVTIPGMDPGSTFQTVLAPGASTIWQTDGTSPYTNGTAVFRADAPIHVQALVTAFDGLGTLLSETAVPDARLRQQFAIPFDITTGLMSGVAVYNPGSDAVTVTLSLLDADGQVAATTQLAAIPPGGRTAGAVTDFFPDTSIARGSLTVATDGSFVSALALRENETVAWPSALPAGAIPLSGTPIQVTTAVDEPHAVSASIGPKGGSLVLTDTGGNKFTLTIPPNALFATEKIVMTPITAAKGMPGSGLVSVQLAPDGLALLQPATLAIVPAHASASTLTAVGWFGSSVPGVYLNLPQSEPDSFSMLLTHFSNAGGTSLTPGDLTSVLLNIVDLQALYQAQAAAAVKGQVPGGPIPQAFYDAIEAEWDQVIEPLIETALTSQDDNVIQCAIYHALAYEQQVELLGIDPTNAIGKAIADFVATGLHILITHTQTRCTDDHDFTALQDLLSLVRQTQLLNSDEPIPDYTALEVQCPYRLQFQMTSLMLSHYTPGGYFKGQVSAQFILNGAWDKQILTSVTDPAVDLYASYVLSNSGQATYDVFAFQTDDDEGCTIVANGLRPGKVTVFPQQPNGKKSQVQFMFTAGYDPAPYSQNGVQLCAFCPVYRKKLVKVDILMDPGLNWEDLTDTCPLVGPQQLSELFWNNSWDTLHPADPTSGFYFFPNWGLVVSQSVLAQFESAGLVTNSDQSTVEQTTMRLVRIP